MKILIPIFSFTKSGGMKVLSNLANNWIDQGHIVTIITTSTDEPYYLTNADIINLNGDREISLFKRIYLLYLFIKKINYLNEKTTTYYCICVFFFYFKCSS